MFESLAIPILWLGGAGLISGLALALAARYLSVKEDERIAKIIALLPGANCGGCGFPGCAGYAAAVVSGDAPCNKCSAGADASAIAAVMGTVASNSEPLVAVVMCQGNAERASRRFTYDGIVDCVAANAIAGGDKTCAYGCLGYGSCVRVCPNSAITIEGGLARIDKSRCIGCGKCASICPRQVIELVPKSRNVHVLCHSKDPGASVRKYCKIGCIGCHICEKKAPGAITVTGFLAHVNYSVPFPEDNSAIASCPMHCLVKESK